MIAAPIAVILVPVRPVPAPTRLCIYAGEPVRHAGHIARTPCRAWESGSIEAVSRGGLLLERLVDEDAFAARGGAR